MFVMLQKMFYTRWEFVYETRAKIINDTENIDKLKRIKLLALDVDGVLTDGGIVYSDSTRETKVFNVKDGLGIRLLIASGIKVCVITGRRSKALYHRCSDLGITDIYDGIDNKAEVINLIFGTDRIFGRSDRICRR